MPDKQLSLPEIEWNFMPSVNPYYQIRTKEGDTTKVVPYRRGKNIGLQTTEGKKLSCYDGDVIRALVKDWRDRKYALVDLEEKVKQPTKKANAKKVTKSKVAPTPEEFKELDGLRKQVKSLETKLENEKQISKEAKEATAKFRKKSDTWKKRYHDLEEEYAGFDDIDELENYKAKLAEYDSLNIEEIIKENAELEEKNAKLKKETKKENKTRRANEKRVAKGMGTVMTLMGATFGWLTQKIVTQPYELYNLLPPGLDDVIAQDNYGITGAVVGILAAVGVVYKTFQHVFQKAKRVVSRKKKEIIPEYTNMHIYPKDASLDKVAETGYWLGVSYDNKVKYVQPKGMAIVCDDGTKITNISNEDKLNFIKEYGSRIAGYLYALENKSADLEEELRIRDEIIKIQIKRTKKRPSKAKV